jgi:hypothetical protein
MPQSLDELLRANCSSKFILIPLTTISFILSLSLVDFRDRTYRAREHSSRPNSGGWSLNELRQWLDPEPYSEPETDEWLPLTDSSQYQVTGLEYNGNEPYIKEHGGQKWVRRKKHRAVAKMQLGDAWDLRRSIMVMLLLCVLLICGLVVYGLKRAWNWAI